MSEQKYVVFKLEGQLYGANIGVVREVNYVVPVTRLPNTPEYVDGVIDLRGEVLPVIDLRKRLHMPYREPDAESRLLILTLRELSAALVVDGVDQVLTIHDDQIVPPDANVTLAGQDYVLGVARVDGKLVVMLDLAKLMDPARH